MGGTSSKGRKRRLSFAVGASDEEAARHIRETLERYGHQVAMSSSPEAPTAKERRRFPPLLLVPPIETTFGRLEGRL